MWHQTIKISKGDYYFSLFIRNRDKMCVRCHNPLPIKRLQNSHYFGRTMHGTRFDEDNCDALCAGCHGYWEKEDREAYRVFKIKQLGEARYNRLQLHALKGKLPDEFMIQVYYYNKLKQMGAVVSNNPRLEKMHIRILDKTPS